MPKPRIAIPIPHSTAVEYAARCSAQFTSAVERFGGEPVLFPLDMSQIQDGTMLALAQSCHGILLPGSGADVSTSRYHEEMHAKTAAADIPRESVDSLLLEHAFKTRKPILGVCFGHQFLNCLHGGALTQHLETEIEHSANSCNQMAHQVSIDKASNFYSLFSEAITEQKQAMGIEIGGDEGHNFATAYVNTSHHQAVKRIGKGLRQVAICLEDGVIEAVEGIDSDHFVIGCQWHPERLVHTFASNRDAVASDKGDPLSCAIFSRFVSESEQWIEKNGNSASSHVA